GRAPRADARAGAADGGVRRADRRSAPRGRGARLEGTGAARPDRDQKRALGKAKPRPPKGKPGLRPGRGPSLTREVVPCAGAVARPAGCIVRPQALDGVLLPVVARAVVQPA